MKVMMNSKTEKEFNNAIHFYTEGIKVNCNDTELKAKLFSNRATAHFYLGEMHFLIRMSVFHESAFVFIKNTSYAINRKFSRHTKRRKSCQRVATLLLQTHRERYGLLGSQRETNLS